MDIAVIGAGYVGLVAAVCLAKSGHMVTCIEKDKNKIEMMDRGHTPFFEESLDELLKTALMTERLDFKQALSEVKWPEIIIVAVGTPTLPGGRVDLSQVNMALAEIAGFSKPVTVVMKSTVTPGTGRRLKEKYLRNNNQQYVSNPEFLREGRAVYDWFNPDRIIIGGDRKAAGQLMEIYSDIDAPVILTDITSAEMIKYSSNAFLATKISFINEIANLCEYVGADIDDVTNGLGMDRRIGKDFLKAGLGYGGSCFPKDTRALDYLSSVNGYNFSLLRAVIDVNNKQKLRVIQKLRWVLGDISGRNVAVLGLAFKPGTDDIRESPALEIINLLAEEGVQVAVYDPVALPKACSHLLNHVICSDSAEQAISGSHAVILTTEWEQFIKLDWQKLKELMKEPYLIIDGRNCLPAEKLRQFGYRYIGIGRLAE